MATTGGREQNPWQRVLLPLNSLDDVHELGLKRGVHQIRASQQGGGATKLVGGLVFGSDDIVTQREQQLLGYSRLTPFVLKLKTQHGFVQQTRSFVQNCARSLCHFIRCVFAAPAGFTQEEFSTFPAAVLACNTTITSHMTLSLQEFM